ncbi:MAG: hypothetical protein HQL95_14505 [Magnetococcales bacterium]|nr:hypothetical protein [Magnetococcales bacterium]
MVDLPGKRAQLEKQAQKAKASAEEKSPSPGATAPGEVAPPTPGQVNALHESLRGEEEIVLAGKLEQLRKKREQELQRGKPKTIEKVDITQLKFAREERKSGLPERIRKLPKDHPVRQLYEKGFKQKGIQVSRGAHETYEEEGLDIKETARTVLKPVGILLLVVGLLVGLYQGAQRYHAGTEDTRHEILALLKEKNYRPDHPKLEKDFKALYSSNWLPDLQRLLNIVQGLSFNYDSLDVNPEPGSYMDYIKRHNKPFNQTDAMEWYAREIRKPSR